MLIKCFHLLRHEEIPLFLRRKKNRELIVMRKRYGMYTNDPLCNDARSMKTTIG